MARKGRKSIKKRKSSEPPRNNRSIFPKKQQRKSKNNLREVRVKLERIDAEVEYRAQRAMHQCISIKQENNQNFEARKMQQLFQLYNIREVSVELERIDGIVEYHSIDQLFSTDAILNENSGNNDDNYAYEGSNRDDQEEFFFETDLEFIKNDISAEVDEITLNEFRAEIVQASVQDTDNHEGQVVVANPKTKQKHCNNGSSIRSEQNDRNHAILKPSEVWVNDKKMIMCPICKRAYSSPGHLYTHMKNAHQMKSIHRCACRMIFYSMDEFDEHKSKCRRYRTFECVFCKFTGQFLNVKHHLQVCHIGSSFVCRICDQIFSWKTAFQRHMRNMHHREKNVHKMKIITHPSERLFSCSFCKQSFRHRTQLFFHMEHVHPEIVMYQCPPCRSRFYSVVEFDEHKLNCSRRRTYECVFCKNKKKTLLSLKDHIRIMHTNEKPFKCDFCHETFCTKTYLDCHLKKHHPNNVREDARV